MRERLCFFVIVLAILSSLSFCIQAQVPGMRKFTQVDGYTATKGYEIEQDDMGNILLGTDNGGMIFDGKKFRIAMDTRQSPDAEILYMRPIDKSRIMLLPLSNSASYIYKGKLFTQAEDKRLKDAKAHQNSCKLDPITGKWWLSNSDLSALVCFEKGDIRKYNFGRPDFSISNIINDCFVGAYLASQDSTYRFAFYNVNTARFQNLYYESGKIAESKNEFMQYAGPDPEYITYYNSDKKQIRIYRLAPPDSTLRFVKAIPFYSALRMPRVTIDRNRNLWVKPFDGKGGIVYYGNIKQQGNLQKPYRFAEPFIVNSAFVDRNSNVWLSTPNNALYFLSEKHFRNILSTSRFPMQKETPQAISGDGLGGLCVSYINIPTLLYMNGDAHQTITPKGDFSQGSRHILPVNENQFLIYHGTIVLMDVKKNTCTNVLLPPLLVKDCCLYGDQGLLIAASIGGYYKEDYKNKKSPAIEIFGSRATSIAVLKDKKIIIGTPIGLYIKQNLQATAVKVNHSVLSESNIVDIQTLHDGGFLVATNSQGVFYANSNGSAVRKITIGNNSGNIRRIYKQNDSTYWLATDEGAYSLLFDKHWILKSFRNYSFYDGLPSNSVTDIYVCRDTAYFTTMHGIGIIPLADGTQQEMPAPGIYINTVASDDTVFYEPDSVIILPYHQNNILVSLSAISFESMGSTGYSYQLYPLHDKWIQTTNPDIRFTGLPPGRYTFRTYATNAKGIKSKHPITLIIEIKPAFWQTIYFKIAVLIIAGLLLYMLTRWNIQRRERTKYAALQQKKRLAELELEAIKAQINPHFIYNCLNSIKYLNYINEYKQSQEYLSIFARLIRMTMQNSRKTFITIAEEVAYLSNYLQLEKLRFKDKLLYTIDIDEEVDRNIMIPAMLLQPYVENTLKHGIAGKEEGSVQVTFQKRHGCLFIIIKDNGPGFSNLKAADSLGMHLAGTRASSYNELFNLDIQVEYYNEQDHDINKTGAVVKITIHTINYGNTTNQSNYR